MIFRISARYFSVSHSFFPYIISGTSASVERIFSLMNDIWSPEKGRLLVETVKPLIEIKFNCQMNCVDFYDSIKGNRDFLNKCLSSDKYNKNREDDSVDVAAG